MEFRESKSTRPSRSLLPGSNRRVARVTIAICQSNGASFSELTGLR
jgi:hypothetical protein